VDTYVCVVEKPLKKEITMTVMGTLAINPNRTWHSRNRNMGIAISEMDTEYLKNCITMINRGYDIRGHRIEQDQISKLGWLVEELAHRDATEGWDA
jgi:hypothetical protein